jgi:hypothetical protein
MPGPFDLIQIHAFESRSLIKYLKILDFFKVLSYHIGISSSRHSPGKTPKKGAHLSPREEGSERDTHGMMACQKG